MPILRPRALEVAAVAIVYILTARLGQILAIPPGNVTPVWIPSGIMLAWALLRGPGIWPGVFLGALAGNVWAYVDLTSASGITSAVIAGVPNGAGDVLASVGCSLLLHKRSEPLKLFESVSAAVAFLVIGVAGGALVSAVFGVTGLLAAGQISIDAYGYVFATWFTGDAIGVLILAPLVLAVVFARQDGIQGHELAKEQAANGLVIAAVVYVAFWCGIHDLARSFALVSLPVLFMWASLRFGRLYNTIALLALAGGITVPTVIGESPFRQVDLNAALINTQLLLGVTGVLVLLLHASREQVRHHVQFLEEARDTLDNKVRERTLELEEAKSKAEQLAAIDTLTGAPNRRIFFKRGNEELNRTIRSGEDASVIMFDLDHFKTVNDTYGHPVGDRVLRDCARITMALLRNYDLFGRIGGEEFAILLPETDEKGALEVAEKLRMAFTGRTVTRHQLNYTASFGVSQIEVADRALSDVLHRADMALYQAKTNGRNCVMAHEDTHGPKDSETGGPFGAEAVVRDPK